MTRRRPPIPAWDELPGPTPDLRGRLEALSAPTPDTHSRLEPLRALLRPVIAAERAAERSAAIRAGQEAARARGVRIGRPRSYTDEEAELVRLAAAHGHSLRRIAAAAGLSLGAVQRIVANA